MRVRLHTGEHKTMSFPCYDTYFCVFQNYRRLCSSFPSLSASTCPCRRDLIVVGAGVIGMEYACMINVVPGTTVTVVDPRPNVLSFADKDVIENLQYTMRQNGARPCRF